ncbi:MAG: geranylgeranylglycerol-phosphate geranylgeranyltransferase [Candidatus Zixiibacteriota bacterium]
MGRKRPIQRTSSDCLPDGTVLIIDYQAPPAYCAQVQKLISILRLIRFHNCLLAGAAVWAGAYMTLIPNEEFKLYLASLAIALSCGAGNAFNDYRDLEADRVNHAKRPLPSGRLLPYIALLTTGVMALFSVVIAIFVSPVFLCAVLALNLLLIFYSMSLKAVPFLGNLAVAAAGASPFIIGAIPSGKAALMMFPGVWIPALFAFLFHLGREIVKDCSDLGGDARGNKKSVPSQFSVKVTLGLVTAILGLLVILTIVPIYFKWYNSIFGFIAVLLVDIPLVLATSYLWISKRERKFALVGSFYKLLMLLGLIAFIAGKNL